MIYDRDGRCLGYLMDPQHADFIVDLINELHANNIHTPNELAQLLEEHRDYEKEIGRLEDKLDACREELSVSEEANEVLRHK